MSWRRGVGHMAEVRVGAGYAVGELMQVGSADDQRARRAQLRHYHSVARRLVTRQSFGAAGEGIALHVHQIFDRHRHASERPKVLARLDAMLELARLAQYRLPAESGERRARA